MNECGLGGLGRPAALIKTNLILASLVVALPSVVGAKDKSINWLEARSPHFIVVCNDGEGSARRLAQQLEGIREFFRGALPGTSADADRRIIVLAMKDETDLRKLLPEYWETERQFHPLGVFRRGLDKYYMAFRMNTVDPYRLLIHEYFHLLAEMNLGTIPLWLNEGLAELWENAEIRGDFPNPGFPIDSHLQRLRKGTVLPVEVLFQADHAWLLHRTEDEVALFYAQSWALVHYLLVGDQADRGQEVVNDFLDRLRGGASLESASRRTFESFENLETSLLSYIESADFRGPVIEARLPVDVPEVTVRKIPRGEWAALQASFLVHGPRPRDAQPLFEEALAGVPNHPLAYEGMGFLHLRHGQWDQAALWFNQAVGVGSRSFLVHYYDAVSRFEEIPDETQFQRITASLWRAIELNPSFAPAYVLLAHLSCEWERNLENALALARKAVELEPNTPAYYVNLSRILLRTGRTVQARETARLGLALARWSAERRLIQPLLEEARKLEEASGKRKGRAGDAQGADRSNSTTPDMRSP